MIEFADTAEDNYIHVNERYAVTVVTDSSLLSVVDLAENWVAHLNFIVSWSTSLPSGKELTVVQESIEDILPDDYDEALFDQLLDTLKSDDIEQS